MSNEVFDVFSKLLKKSAEVLEQNTNLDFGLGVNSESKEEPKPSNEVTTSNNVTISKLEASDNYIDLRIRGRKTRFKLADPTMFRVDTDTGAAEVDAGLIPLNSKGELWEEGSKTHICFSNGNNIFDDEIRERVKRWYKVDNLTIENINEVPFEKHIKAENSSLYYEEYCMYYDSNVEGEITRCPYEIYIILYKNEYSMEDINRLISEFHVVIDTFELLELENLPF